jgi:hypothetical protein
MKKRIKFLSDDLEKRKKKIEVELKQLEKIYSEIITLQKKVELDDEQDNSN